MKYALTLLLSLLALPMFAISVHGLENGHICGPALKQKDVEKKVVAVFEWGLRCPRCHAAMPNVAQMAKKYAKDKRVVMIASHFQGRNDEKIKEKISSSGFPGSVYQFLRVEGAPMPSLLPTAYVVNHKGEVVWSGSALEGFKDFQAAIENAVKAMPKAVPGSLISGVELTYAKDMARRLVVGHNVEAPLKQLQAKAAKGGAAAEEAKALIACCEEWAKEAEAEISANLETKPSKALARGKEYVRTFPSRAAELKEQLVAASKDPITAKLATSRQTLENLRNANASTANARKMLLNKVNLQLRQLGTLTVDAANEDYAEVKALWEAFSKELAK